MAQQTAVEWLESELDFLYQYMAERDRSKLFEQAKAMEKEQIIKAAQIVLWNNVSHSRKEAEQYYNETYDRAADTNKAH
jgi:hypothetical protein